MSDPVKRERELCARGGAVLTLLAKGRGWPREVQQDVLKSVIRILRGENIDLDCTRVVLDELIARRTERAEDGSVEERTPEELATIKHLVIEESAQEHKGFRRMTDQEIGGALWLGSPPEALEELRTVLHVGADLELLRQDPDRLWAVSLRGKQSRPESETGQDSQTIPKRPSDNAFKAWRLRDLIGLKTQEAIAEAMSKELGRNVNQGEVSRWLKEVDEYRRAGGIFPDLPRLTGKPDAVNPSVIDMGERVDKHSKRQRERRDPDAD